MAPSVSVHLWRPGAGTTVGVGALINGVGWVTADVAVSAVDIGIDAAVLGRARLGLSASELAMLIGDAPPGPVTGFVFAVQVPRLPPGPVKLRLHVETAGGRYTQDVALTIVAAAATAEAPPTVPAAASSGVRGTIEAAVVNDRGILRAAGWLVSLVPVESVHVFLGELGFGEAQCGIARDDVAAHWPEYPNAGHAGFLLRREVPEAALAESELRLVVTTRDGVDHHLSAPLRRPERVQRQRAEPLANLACEEALLAADGEFFVKGWAVASSGVADIRIELDEVPVATITPNEQRPDVGNRYPDLPDAARAGFRLRRRLASVVPGAHLVRIFVRGRAGEEYSASQVIEVDLSAVSTSSGAAVAALPKNAAITCFLDAPACTNGAAIGVVRGFLTLSGWAFGDHGIDRVEVFVDRVSQGRAHHGIRREDLGRAFPDQDTLLAGFAMVLPPPVMKPGERQVRIEIHDRAGHSEALEFIARAEPAAAGAAAWSRRRKMPQAEIDLQHHLLTARAHAPRWAVVLVLPDAAPERFPARLIATLNSLGDQAYGSWTAILIAPPAKAADVTAALARMCEDVRANTRVLTADPPRRLAEIDATMDFAILLEAGDELGEDALLELSVETLLHPTADFIYSDERRTDPADGIAKAFFKPDFSPDLLLSTNYVGRVWAASAALLRAADLREGDLAQFGEFDAVLRLTEQARRVRHVSKVLCERGRSGGTREMDRLALRRAMDRRGIRGTVHSGPVSGSYRITRDIAGSPTVSIIMPTNGSAGLVEIALRSIRQHTAWSNYEIICLDTMPATAEAAPARLRQWIAEQADVVIPAAGAFNWSRLNNVGARRARGDLLLFLNDDIEVRDPRWLHGLIEQAQRPEVGTVGAQLLYPDGRVQHAGVFLGRHAARHAFRFYAAAEPGPFGLALTQRDVISVTGACMMVRRDVFQELGGFDESHPVVNNDLDFNLRVRRSGRAVVYTPAVSLVHHEMASRAALADTYNTSGFAAQWGDLFATGDPFFNRNLSIDHDDYQPEAEPVRSFVAGRPLFARAKIRRILAVKVDHIGDFVTAFPAFRRIKQHFPQAHLTVLAAKASLALAALEPAIDQVLEFNFYDPRSEKGRRHVGKRQLAALRAQLAPQRFDLALDLRRQPDTRPVLRTSGARWLAGFDSLYQHPWLDITVEFEGDLARHWKSGHVTDSLVGLVDAVAAQGEPDRRLIGHLPDREAAWSLLERLTGVAPLGPGGGAVVCVHTGAGSLNKQWPAAAFAELIDWLVGQTRATVVVIGGAEEAAFAQDVVARTRRGERVCNLVGKTGLGDLPGVLSAADLYVGNDSGPKHIAAALGVPTIGIHSGSVDAGEWGAVGPRALTIRRDMVCSPCYLARAADCHRGLACLGGIAVADVAEACRRMLAWPAAGGARYRPTAAAPPTA